jgi:O-succinylbenzoic acid--CoA ligase
VAHEGFDAAAVRAELMDEAAGITHLSLVPPMLARLLDAGAEPPPWLRVVLLGGQALDPALARRALAGGWPLVLGYGMTETGSMIASGRVRDGGEVVLTPLPGVELDCPSCDPRTGTAMDASQVRGPQVERSAAVPRPLRLRGPMLMAGYANPRRQPGDGLSADGWLTTSDLACHTPDGTLRVLGRADEVLVIGGVNVLPAAIERRLAAAPGIGEVAVAGVPEPVWGRRLIAVYTGPVDPARLDAWCRANLPSAERPRGFRRVAGLPVLASGKLDRRALVRSIEEERE